MQYLHHYFDSEKLAQLLISTYVGQISLVSKTESQLAFVNKIHELLEKKNPSAAQRNSRLKNNVAESRTVKKSENPSTEIPVVGVESLQRESHSRSSSNSTQSSTGSDSPTTSSPEINSTQSSLTSSSPETMSKGHARKMEPLKEPGPSRESIETNLVTLSPLPRPTRIPSSCSHNSFKNERKSKPRHSASLLLFLKMKTSLGFGRKFTRAKRFVDPINENISLDPPKRSCGLLFLKQGDRLFDTKYLF